MVEPSGVSDSILVHSFRKAYLYQLRVRHRIQYCRRYRPQAQGPTPSRRGVQRVHRPLQQWDKYYTGGEHLRLPTEETSWVYVRRRSKVSQQR